MRDVKVDVVIKNLGLVEEKTTYSVEGKFDRKKGLVFTEIGEETNTTHHFYLDENRLVMERENQEMKMSLIFEEDNEHASDYFYKDLDFKIPLSTMTEEARVNFGGGQIYVKYYLDLNMENQGCFELEINFE
jgi:uncharacterized beta-barrel protein YwiB (DUF1934 family)